MSTSVLIVDDSIASRVLMRQMLETGGYECAEAPDGASAVALLRTSTVDVVVTDQWMPIMTGIELVRLIRADADLRDVPVLAVTTDVDTDRRDEILGAGASGFITKPFTTEEFLDAVGQLTGDRE